MTEPGLRRAHNEAGGYWYLPAFQAYSAGVIADEGHHIVHLRLRDPMPLEAGMDVARRLLDDVFGRPPAALCAVELRSPRPVGFRGFAQFNRSYVSVLERLGLLIGGVNPVARNNVVPLSEPPRESSLTAFSFTVPRASEDPAGSFITSGAAETAGLSPELVVRRGEHDAPALREKAAFTLGRIRRRVFDLGGRQDAITGVNVYTAHPVDGEIREAVFRESGGPASVRWHAATPPIRGLEFQVDVRSIDLEMVAAGKTADFGRAARTAIGGGSLNGETAADRDRSR
jgi:hypothetical protein